jgi:Cu+-exporting ATPase
MAIDQSNSVELKIKGMHCSACVITVERALNKVNGVRKSAVNLTLEKARIEGDASLDQLIKAVEGTGYEAELIESDKDLQDNNPDEKLNHAKNQMIFAWVVTATIMLWMIPKWVTGIMWPNPSLYIYGMISLSLLILAFPGRDTIKSAWRSAIHLSPNMDVLITLGALASLTTGLLKAVGLEIHSFAGIAGMIMAFHLTGRYIEVKARGKSSDAIKRLMSLGAKKSYTFKR